MRDAPPRGVFISLSLLCRALEEAQRPHGQIVLVIPTAPEIETNRFQLCSAVHSFLR